MSLALAWAIRSNFWSQAMWYEPLGNKSCHCPRPYLYRIESKGVQHTARRPESGTPGISIRPAKPTRPTVSTDTVQHEKYSELVARLIDDFQRRFEDFRKHSDIMKLLSDPFQVDPTGAAVKGNSLTFRMSDLKRAFGDQARSAELWQRLCFIRQLPQSVTGCQEFHFSVWYCLLLRATVFENEKHTTKSGSLLTDEHLTASLHISTSTVGADTDRLLMQTRTMPNFTLS